MISSKDTSSNLYLHHGDVSPCLAFDLTFFEYTLFYKQDFYKQQQAKIGKKKARAKQHLEAKLFLFENYLLSSFTRYHPKIIGDILKKSTRNKCVCFSDIIWLIAMKMRLKMKNRSKR